ncbi:MAG: hypothetical protein K9H15_03300 [Bacteroidales bacterium]|nr:hypothetical protein [Bacteroidales bacterium]MCF8350164.1 hypothetical protein [Bacteroidales bacterium]
MKINYLIIFLFIASTGLCHAQDLEKGSYEVGFNDYKTHDVSRKYIVNSDTIARPLLIHFWYPADGNAKKESLYFRDYIDLIAIREDFNRPASEVDEHSFNFVDAYAGFAKQRFGLDTNITTQQILDCPVIAKHGIPMAKQKQKFPLIIYAPSNSKSAVQNHVIFEYLASHGYLVLSVGSAGENSIKRENHEQSILAQVEDMEYMLAYFEDSLKIEYSSLGLMDFSSGGPANAIFQMKHQKVKAVFSMDGSQEYGYYMTLFKMEDFDLENTNVPHCLVVNNFENFSIYPYYNSIISADKYLIRMPYLDHNGFVSFWNFFNTCSSQESINQFCDSFDSICSIALLFFNTYLQAGTSSEHKIIFQTNEYVQPKTIDNSLTMQLCNSILANGMDTAMIFLNQNQEIFKTKENEINMLGKMFIDNEISTAIQLLTFNTTHHPDSWKANFDLGFAYKENGDLALSKQALLKARQLNPGNGEITKMLDEMNEH